MSSADGPLGRPIGPDSSRRGGPTAGRGSPPDLTQIRRLGADHTTVITREVSGKPPSFRVGRKKLETKSKLTRRFIEEWQFPGYAFHRTGPSPEGRPKAPATRAWRTRETRTTATLLCTPRSLPDVQRPAQQRPLVRQDDHRGGLARRGAVRPAAVRAELPVPAAGAVPRPRGRRAADGPVDAGDELAELRRPEPPGARAGVRRGRPEGYRLGPGLRPPRPPRPAVARRPCPKAEVVRRRLWDAAPDPIDTLEDGVFSAIRQTRRSLHVHSERIFLVGIGEGAAVAYRLGLSYPERFAGVVAINGWVPGGFRPLGRLKACRDLRILVVHGEWNARVPVRSARRDVATLRAGGLRVAFQSYPCAHRITSPMLSDVDTWLINHCTTQF